MTWPLPHVYFLIESVAGPLAGGRGHERGEPGAAMTRRQGACAACLLVVLLAARPVFALVKHTDAEPSSRPFDAVVAHWAGGTSAVVVGDTGMVSTPYALTTCHQGGGLGTTVAVDGSFYTVADEFRAAAADLRVAVLESDGGPAALTQYASVPGNGDLGMVVALGGYGYGRGQPLVAGSPPDDYVYGYAWTDPGVLRWGENRTGPTAGRSSVVVGGKTYTSDFLRIDFDETGLACEASLASGDSGSGWFVPAPGDQWSVVGLGWTTTSHTGPLGRETWFRDPTDPANSMPDVSSGIRLASYATWINSVLAGAAWDAEGGGEWADASRWTTPVAPGGTDTVAVLGGAITGPSNVTLTAPVTLGHLRCDSPRGYTLRGAALQMDVSIDAAILEVTSRTGAGTHVLDVPVTSADPLLVRVDGGCTLALAGGVSAAGLLQTGSGTTVLGAAGTFSDAVRVEAGTLRLGAPGALGDADVHVDGGTLLLRADVPVAVEGRLLVDADSTVSVGRETPGPSIEHTVADVQLDFGRRLRIAGADAALRVTGTFDADGTLEVHAGSHVILDGPGAALALGPASTLVKEGEGAWTIGPTAARDHGPATTLRVAEGTVTLAANLGARDGGAMEPNLSLEVEGGVLTATTVQDLYGLTVDATSARFTLAFDPGIDRDLLRIHNPLTQVETVWEALCAAHEGGTWDGAGLGTNQVEDATRTGLGLVDTGTSLAVREMILGDVNGDDFVDGADALILLDASHFNRPGTWLSGDLNYDGFVDGADALILYEVRRFEHRFDAATGQAAPEPGAAALLALGLAALVRRRR